MTKYILDIETKINPDLQEIFSEFAKQPKTLKDPEKIEAWKRKKNMVDIDYADIACIGLKELGKEGKILSLKEMEAWFADREFIPATSRWETDAWDFEFITFNGKAFDIPLLIRQGLKNNLKFPYRYLVKMTNKWKNNGHTDLMTELGDFGRNKSLDHYLGIYLGIRKDTVGDDFFKNATQADLEEHCLMDLDQSEKLYEMFKKVL